ncbi:MAG TPA: signal recognition particle subunit SRP19/SEC65 family protein [Geobacterales bacterium]|nr:signal recognition particle subunit SRP19/SEC65 family protein [Geobacterales bacterium]
MKKRDYTIIWPSYIEANLSRKEGRRVPLKLAVEKVRLEEIAIAASELSYKYEIINDTAYPRNWWIKGCVKLYPRKDKKTLLLKKIAQKIRENRSKK